MIERKRGFTLVELSIVLVIIGLLTGGILVARSLISSAKVSAQVSQLQQYDIAMSLFTLNLNCIPGDCPYAIGNASGQVGNGNNVLQDVGNNVPPTVYWNENYLFFPMLSAYIKEQYQLVGCHFVPGENFPELKLGKGGIGVTGNRNNVFYILGLTVNSTTICSSGNGGNMFEVIQGGSISPVDAVALDTKMDDGLYSTGNVVAIVNTGDDNNDMLDSDGEPYPHNVAANDGTCISAGSTYNVAANEERQCTLLVKAGLARQ